MRILLLLLLASPAAAQDVPLRVYGTLPAETTAVLDHVFARSALGIEWDCRTACVTVRLIDRAPATIAVGVLGYGLAENRVVTIFRDRVGRLAAQAHTSEATVLGVVMAHEIAHVLGLDHARAGIMRAKLDLTADAFTPEEAAQLRSALNDTRIQAAARMPQ